MLLELDVQTIATAADSISIIRKDKMLIDNKRKKHVFLKSVLICVLFTICMASLISCEDTDTKSSSEKTVTVDHIRFVVISIPQKAKYMPDWIDVGDEFYIPKDYYDAFSEVIAIISQKFEKNEAVSEDELMKSYNKIQTLESNTKLNQSVQHLIDSAKTEKEQRKFTFLPLINEIGSFNTSYGEKVNSFFFSGMNKETIDVDLTNILSDQELRDRTLFVNYLFPKTPIKIYKYIDVNEYIAPSTH
jgi:hypothetical protein